MSETNPRDRAVKALVQVVDGLTEHLVQMAEHLGALQPYLLNPEDSLMGMRLTEELGKEVYALVDAHRNVAGSLIAMAVLRERIEKAPSDVVVGQLLQGLPGKEAAAFIHEHPAIKAATHRLRTAAKSFKESHTGRLGFA